MILLVDCSCPPCCSIAVAWTVSSPVGVGPRCSVNAVEHDVDVHRRVAVKAQAPHTGCLECRPFGWGDCAAVGGVNVHTYFGLFDVAPFMIVARYPRPRRSRAW